MEIEDKQIVYGECTYRLVPKGGRAERVPNARLNLSAEHVKCNGYYIIFVAKEVRNRGKRIYIRDSEKNSGCE